MYKIVTLSKRKDGMTQEQFKKYWSEVHGAMILKMVPAALQSRIKRYAQYPAAEIKGRRQPYDGVAEFCFEDFDSLLAWSNYYKSDESKTLRDDQAMFVDMSTVVTVITEEKVIIGK